MRTRADLDSILGIKAFFRRGIGRYLQSSKFCVVEDFRERLILNMEDPRGERIALTKEIEAIGNGFQEFAGLVNDDRRGETDGRGVAQAC